MSRRLVLDPDAEHDLDAIFDAIRVQPSQEAYMKPLIVEYPKELPGLLKMTEEQFAVEVRFLAAAKLFELGKLSSGKAAAMAGLRRVEFLHKLGGYGFHAINLHDEQIEAELNAATELAP